MSGATSRSGFAFQDLVLAERVLEHIHARRAGSIGGTTAPDLTFGVEAAPAGGKTPEWDIFESDGATLILEEAKSGSVEAEDRWTLWRRIRRTAGALASSGDTRSLSVRLTVNAASLPSNPEYWRALAKTSLLADGNWTTPGKKEDGTDERRQPVRSAQNLANEALHVLTNAAADPQSQAVELATARAILSRFSLNEQHSADSVEASVRTHLDALSRGVGVAELLAGLRGEIAQRAESHDGSRRSFTADELLRSFAILERLATIDPATLRRWQSLHTTSSGGSLDPNGRLGGLAYQDWRTIQPAAFLAFRNPQAQAVALVGRGGIGKSVLMQHWLTEREDAGDETLSLLASDLASLEPDQISAAIDVGAFAARHRGRRLMIGVDGLENLADAQQRLKILSALRSIALDGVVVCVTCRLLEWRSARGTSQEISGWDAVELDEWPEDRVRDLVNASGRRRVSADLLRLLRTPLLLDLFLRTFGRDAAVPSGLQTRHGLLQAYWDRRILPDDDERSAERRVTLLQVAAAEAVGIRAHTLSGESPRELTSEGLFSLSRGGLRSFRHGLLRDFAMMIWANEGTRSAEQIVAKIEAIQPSLVQFGTLRAVLEAADAGKPAGTQILSALNAPLIFHAGTVLGEFEDLSHVALAPIVDAIREDQRSGFLRSLLAAIKLDQNIAWATVFARLPDDAQWAQSTSWITSDFLLQTVEAFEANSDALATDTSQNVELATRLRAWSVAPKFLDSTFGGSGYMLGRTCKLLAKLDASPETVAWLVRIAALSSWTRFWVLSELPALVQTLAKRGRIVEDEALRLAYCLSAGLRNDAGRLRSDANIPQDQLTSYNRIEYSLIGREHSAGLIATRPSAFVSVAIDLVAGHEADDADEREQRHRELAAALPADLKWFTEPTEEVKDVEAKARAHAGEELLEEDAGGLLVVDNPANPYWEIDADYAQLLRYLRDLAEASLAGDSAFFDLHFWPSVARSRSALARACVLDLLTREKQYSREAILDELLLDGRLYFVRSARPYLQRGIRRRWASLPTGRRDIVLANVLRCGREPSGSIYWPGPFFAVIPELDRPPASEVFVALYRSRGWTLELEEARPMSVVSGHRIPEPKPTWVNIAGLSTEQQEPWQQLARCARGTVAQATSTEWTALVDAVEQLVARCLPAPDALLNKGDLVERLTEFAALHTDNGGASERASRLSAEATRSLARWSVDSLRAFDKQDVVADCEPFDGVLVGLPPKADLWMHLADLADSVLWEPELKDDEELNAELFSAIDDITEPPARLAWNILARVGGWFRAQGQGKPVLWTLLSERVRNARALSTGLRFLEKYSKNEQEELLRKWLATELSPAISPARAFARDIGSYVGWAAIVRYEGTEQPTGSYDVVRELVPVTSAAGLLSDASVHALFVGQSVFGAKEAVANGGVPTSRADEFAANMAACWRALLPSFDEAERKDAPAFALWVFHPILESTNENPSKFQLNGEDRLTWWRALKSLAIAIFAEGPSREICSLLRCMNGSPLLDSLEPAELIEVLVPLNTRIKALTGVPMGYYWSDAISSASAIIEFVGTRTSDVAERDRLHAYVATWGAPPLSVETASAAAKRLRA